MKPLSVPMEIVLQCIAEKRHPISLYPAGQLRLILNGLQNRGLVRYRDTVGQEWHLTVAGRNYIIQKARERSS
jgi:hypothetical protein